MWSRLASLKRNAITALVKNEIWVIQCGSNVCKDYDMLGSEVNEVGCSGELIVSIEGNRL